MNEPTKAAPVFNLPGVKLTPCCPKCDRPMTAQPSERTWHCVGCKTSQPMAPQS